MKKKDIIIMLKAGGIVSLISILLFWITKIEVLAYMTSIGLLVGGVANLILYIKYKQGIKKGGS